MESLPIYAAQCRARRSFLSNALMFAPLAKSKLTIWKISNDEVKWNGVVKWTWRFLFPVRKTPTSTWPFSAAWCKAVRPPRSETLTLLSRGMITSAHLTALLAAATCRGVCQFLSLALTSAECLINTCTASYSKSRVCRGHWQTLDRYLSGARCFPADPGTTGREGSLPLQAGLRWRFLCDQQSNTR